MPVVTGGLLKSAHAASGFFGVDGQEERVPVARMVDLLWNCETSQAAGLVVLCAQHGRTLGVPDMGAYLRVQVPP